MVTADFSYEKDYWNRRLQYVLGADEVGRGCLAGPVVAGVACAKSGIQNQESGIKEILKLGINDSKLLSAKKREELVPCINEFFHTAVGEASVAEINREGIVPATRKAMRRAIQSLVTGHLSLVEMNLNKTDDQWPMTSDKLFLLLDAFYLPNMKGIPRKNQLAIIKGDQKCISIAAASIIAKVYRDNLMKKLSLKLPVYKWEQNVGYGTKLHKEALRSYGPSTYHRTLFIRTTLG